MAIDFGRMARGIATGYLGQKLANTAANDELKSRIIERAGINFYENTLPEFQKREKNRSDTYKKLSSKYGINVAEYMDQEGFITGSTSDYANIVKDLGANDNLNETKLKSYLEATNAGSYESRKQGRVSDIQDREKFVTGNLSKNQIGDMTAKLFLSQGETMTDASEATAPKTMAETVTTPAVPGSQVGPQVTEAVPEKTETKEVPLATFEDIFGKGEEKLQTDFSAMPYEDKTRIIDDARQEYQTTYGFDKLTGAPKIPEEYDKAYNKLKKEGKVGNKTIEAYAYDRFFKEQYLPKVQIGYNEPYAVTTARRAINYQRSINNETGVQQAKDILKSMGIDPNDYGL
jgi:ribosomal protein S8